MTAAPFDASDRGTAAEAITRLEDRIGALAETLDRCRKIDLAAKLALTAGAAWIALMLVRLVPVSPGQVVWVIAALVGGTVAFGSNVSTRRQTETAIAAAEAERRALIGRIGLTLVGDVAEAAPRAGPALPPPPSA